MLSRRSVQLRRMSQVSAVTLQPIGTATWSPTRRAEPITVGIPFPRGLVRSAADLRVSRLDAGAVPLQVRSLSQWPDGSIRWALLDFVVDGDAGQAPGYRVTVEPGVESANADLQVTCGADGVEVSTGVATFRFSARGAFPFSDVIVGSVRPIDIQASGLRVEHDGRQFKCLVSQVRLLDSGPLRVELEIDGVLDPPGGLPLEVFAKVEVFARSATARLDIGIRNVRRAIHTNGQWPLGDPGSIFLSSVGLVFSLNSEIARLQCAPEPHAPLADVASPFELFQESSGGEHWNGAVHQNRDGRVPLRFRGYRMRTGTAERSGSRANPVVAIETTRGEHIAVAVPQFWENFPKAIGVRDKTLEIGLFPAGAADVHELQGGEQKAHQIVVAFSQDSVSDPPLAWVHDPLCVYPAPDWCAASQAVPFLIPTSDISPELRALVEQAVDPMVGFMAKREAIDEYGWRNFGDLLADHESARQPPDKPFVSHYNNQYDALAGFAVHFLRTGDPRWWRLLADLARHVRDIDIYHTAQDKPAYNGGLFWHTAHYTDASTSTHRTYPKGGPIGGGPSAEHNYNLGLMLHYFLTGERASAAAAIGLAQWAIDMDDGRLTPFRWLAGGDTGLATATGSMTYHGPGRAGANSIMACLVAHELTGRAVFAEKADDWVRRCIHPDDDLEALNLLDVERRWYYTVYLQALGAYLDRKWERGELDEMFHHARASLLHYARWMIQHERPYLDRPELLEFPTETWAAQDIRKADVFVWAAIHSPPDERGPLLERAEFFFQYSTGTLSQMPQRRFTRPIALLMLNGLRYSTSSWRAQPPRTAPAVTSSRLPRTVAFETQKVRALRRAKLIVVSMTALAAIAIAFLLW